MDGEWKPTWISTLEDHIGVTVDDGCFVVLIRQPNGRWVPTCWIPKEASALIRELGERGIGVDKRKKTEPQVTHWVGDDCEPDDEHAAGHMPLSDPLLDALRDADLCGINVVCGCPDEDDEALEELAMLMVVELTKERVKDLERIKTLGAQLESFQSCFHAEYEAGRELQAQLKEVQACLDIEFGTGKRLADEVTRLERALALQKGAVKIEYVPWVYDWGS